MKRYIPYIALCLMLIGGLVWAIPPMPPGSGGGVATTDFDTSAEFFTILTDEVGSGSVVGATAPTFVTSVGLPNTITSAGTVTWTMVDNQNAAIAFRADGANDILKLTTTDSGPGATVTGFFTSTGLITGDDVTANDALTGLSVTATGGNLKLGGNDTIYGLLDLYGAATGSDNGGYAKFYTAADHDTTINEYGIRVLQDDMIIGPDTNADFIKITAGAALDVDGVVTATGFVGNLTGDVTGNADSASALAADPTDCAALGLATAIDASGNLTCGYAIGTDVPGISGTPTDEQIVCWEQDGSAWKQKACGAKTTYTEPASNVTLCRTGAGTTGACVNPVKLAVFAWDGGESAVTTGATTKRCVVLPGTATVTGVFAIADASTTTHIHVYQDAFATDARATTVTGAVDIGATLGSKDTTLTSWDKSITAEDEICMSVEANDNAKWLNVTVYGTY